MVPFQHKDERRKIIVYIIIIFIIQGVLLGTLYYNSIKSINNKVIAQNIAIISKAREKDEDLAKDIAAIITGKEKINENNLNEEGNILLKYSYDKELSYKDNPLVGNVAYKYTLFIIVMCLLILILIIVVIIYFINPLFKEIQYLTYRAENIVENKPIKKERTYKYRGSLDKFILKFSMMEERIYNNIELLNEEKINLKNIINDISHQLKTPLMALSMYNEILIDHRNMEDEDVDSFVNLSKEQLERMEWLVKTLLKYARLESNVVEYHKENFLLNNTVEESINPLIVKAEEKGQTLIFISDKEIYYYHDRNWLGEAFSNIIKNAIEHTGVNGKVEVGLEETPVTIRVWVKDNGEGIDKREIKKIFERFHKGENSLNPSSIGIGLCLSKSIVKAHDGDITVESELGIGSTFYITFIKK